MEDQFIDRTVRIEVELHSGSLSLDNDEGSALVGAKSAGWFAPNCQRELSNLKAQLPFRITSRTAVFCLEHSPADP
jgi:hypothetical protein